MRDFTKNLHSAPTLPVLELVKELTIGQRAADTIVQLADFLHARIFPKLGPFCIEIYFPDNLSGNFLPSRVQVKAADHLRGVPEQIAGDHPILERLAQSGAPLHLPSRLEPPLGPAATNDRAELLVPIQDGPELSALLYLGCRESCAFPGHFLDAVQTLATIIGSRLKSMASIRQLQESMQALEYSDRLRTALYDISAQAHSSENIADLYAKLHQTVGRLIHARNFYIALVEQRPDGKYIQFPYFVDRNDTQFQGLELRLDHRKCSITGYLLKSRQPLLLTPTNFDQVCREQRLDCVGTRPHSWLGAPFFTDDIAGAVAVQSYRKTIYTEKDKELMAFVARHIGDALNRKRAVDELKKAKERAEQAEKNKSTFLANMSHEIRTPMNGILGLTDLVLQSDITGQKRTYLEMIRSSADRLLKLINDILDFSKIEAGKLELNIAPFALRDTIAGALDILAIGAAKKNIALTVDCHESVPDALLGDAGKLSQVLINLVGNGVKFTKRGQVALSVRRQDHGSGPDEPVKLHFQIRDTGIGIPETKINSIFKAFSQIGTTRSSAQGGTGLGLVIAGELVEMMGGKICVESRPGIGTAFSFTVQFLPGPADTMLPRRVEAGAIHAEVTKRTGKPLSILLVEDEYINRTLAVTVLERQGWQVQVAENGLQAMAMLKDLQFDLVLMDIQMPELDGYQTTRNIRLQEASGKRHIPIIAMTAYAVKGDREKCLAAGMDGYIAKPIRPEQLIDEIETVLSSMLSIRPGPRFRN